MSPQGSDASQDWQVRVGQEELGRIFHLRDSLDQSEDLIQHVTRYQELGWVLEAQGEEASGLDFGRPSEEWTERLMTLALAGVAVNVGVRTGAPSQLLVLEVRRGETALDRYGQWRSPCRTQTTDGWEQHYYALSGGLRIPLTGEDIDLQVKIYGQGGLVLAPPSRRAVNAAIWTWLVPPWEVPPVPPQQPLWRFLEDCGLLPLPGEGDAEVGLLTWEQVYAVIAPHESLVRTLLSPAASPEIYYLDLVQAALQAGITDQALLLALLWHAPQGDARTSLERLEYLRKLVATVTAGSRTAGQDRPAPGAPSPLPLNPSRPQMDDLVGFMENRVILDRSRYENMVYELASLAAKAEALERRLEEQERLLKAKAAAPVGPSGDVPGISPLSQRFLPDYPAEALPLRQSRPTLRHLKGVVQEFLEKNADLATDANSVQMLQFCLKNYIDLNPELNSLPLRKKLEMAGNMAREFLQRVGQAGT